MTLKKTPLNQSDSEELAVQVLVFMADDEKRFKRYLNVTGLDPATIRTAAKDSNFLASILDYLMQDESLLIQFCEMQGYDPASIASGHALLGGSQRTPFG